MDLLVVVSPGRKIGMHAHESLSVDVVITIEGTMCIRYVPAQLRVESKSFGNLCGNVGAEIVTLIARVACFVHGFLVEIAQRGEIFDLLAPAPCTEAVL